jgi:tRNA nucleotidyltransferase (CCA-adding enzyme)
MSYPDCIGIILRQIEPTPDERRKISKKAEEIKTLIERNIVEATGDEAVKVEYHGSFRHDTWLSGQADLDLFILFPKKYTLEEMDEFVRRTAYKVAKNVNASVEERYASHPYYTLLLKDGLEVELVPAYRVFSSEEVTTPVDRTQLHTEYLQRVLSERQYLKDEIRIFKKLLINLNIYGAEQSVHGFSGYLAEVLITYFGGLERLLLEASSWKPGRIHIPPIPEARRFFKGQPIVVIDPTDSRRNAAASVGLEALSKLILVAKLFSENKDIICCLLNPPRLTASAEDLLPILNSANVIVAVATHYPKMPEDALMAKLQRIARRVSNAVETLGFRILRVNVGRVKGLPSIWLQPESSSLPSTFIHWGPPIWHQNALHFARKWITRQLAPIILNERLAVIRSRVSIDAKHYLSKILLSHEEFSWEIFDLKDLVSSLSEKETLDIYKWLTGMEDWTMCILARNPCLEQ